MFRTSTSLTELRTSLQLIEQRLTPLIPEYPQLLENLRNCQVQLANASTAFRLAAARSCDPELLQLLRSVPGIGELTAPALVAELDDITRFPGPKQLVAFAGLDPRVKQSGSTLNRYGHLTKRGAPHLRRMLYIAATVARRYDPVCRALYEKKRAEGKRFKEAIMVVARKLQRIVYCVWTSGKPYEVRA
jgi:transposase